MDESIKEYLRHIGSKGGKVVAGTPQAKARAAKAAKARWAKRKQKKSEKRKFTYATLIFGAIALAALGCMIRNPSNWVALDNLRRFCLADLAQQTKAWHKGLSFEKDPPPAVV